MLPKNSLTKLPRPPRTSVRPVLREGEDSHEARGNARTTELPTRFSQLATAALVLIAGLMLGGECTHSDSPPPGGPVPPTVSITLNGVPEGMNDLLVVPPTGFVVNISYQPNDYPIDPDSLILGLGDYVWSSLNTEIRNPQYTSIDATGAVWQVPPDFTGFTPGSHTLYALIADVNDNRSYNMIPFAVREFPGSPPIGTGQKIWFDFEHDATRDFSADLEAFGLGSASAPVLSAKVERLVIAALLDRMSVAYHEQDPADLGQPEPVAVDFFSADPGPGDVTRVCVGGEDPSGGSIIGTILLDPNNGRRSGEECGSLPPTGIFPRELLVLQADPTFQETFDPLRSSRGGIPVGEHPLDPILLDDLFDPESVTLEELGRYNEIQRALERFGAVLGSIMAHEIGHALGLVPPSAPGIGLYGGDSSSGPRYTHAVTPDGGDPPENYLMKAGNTFSFSKLGGLNGYPLPTFRPLSYAYLRDRTLAYLPITELLGPPAIDSVDPPIIERSAIRLSITGNNFAGTPAIRLVNGSFLYHVVGEALVSEQLATGWVIRSQIAAGTYDLELINSDGQLAVLPGAITVP